LVAASCSFLLGYGCHILLWQLHTPCLFYGLPPASWVLLPPCTCLHRSVTHSFSVHYLSHLKPWILLSYSLMVPSIYIALLSLSLNFYLLCLSHTFSPHLHTAHMPRPASSPTCASHHTYPPCLHLLLTAHGHSHRHILWHLLSTNKRWPRSTARGRAANMRVRIPSSSPPLAAFVLCARAPLSIVFLVAAHAHLSRTAFAAAPHIGPFSSQLLDPSPPPTSRLVVPTVPSLSEFWRSVIY